ncbi:hypothetical protein L9F63_013487, partial [Diploptera punctata]
GIYLYNVSISGLFNKYLTHRTLGTRRLFTFLNRFKKITVKYGAEIDIIHSFNSIPRNNYRKTEMHYYSPFSLLQFNNPIIPASAFRLYIRSTIATVNTVYNIYLNLN